MSNANNSNLPLTHWGASNYTEVRINPPAAIVRKIILNVYKSDLLIGGVEFFDVQGTSILKAGYLSDHSSYFKKEILIGEGERLVGVKGKKCPSHRPRLLDV